MHGIIFSEFKRYASARLGPDGWERLLTTAKLNDRIYLISEPYPDVEAASLARAAAQLTQLPEDKLQEDFGRFIAPTLMSMYKRLIQPTWRSLDLIENAETTIHTVVRLRNKGATPPMLKTTRTSPNTVRITYSSHRKMCHLATGIAYGVGDHFGETLAITQAACMLKGAPQCEIDITRR